MRQPMVAGNWKMNGARAFTGDLVDAVCAGSGTVTDAVDVVICPPFPYLCQAVDGIPAHSRVAVGGQNLDPHPSGAFTGEVSASMLLDCGCRYVITGHSERRTLFGETSAQVADKTLAALEAGLTPLVCVGETLGQRESGTTEAVIAEQLDAVVDRLGIAACAGIVVAYEPVWAIGTGKTASPEQAQAVHAFIRGRLAESDASVAAAVRILYGGSVKPDNAAGLFSNQDIDGGLIGGAALNAADFLSICSAAAQRG